MGLVLESRQPQARQSCEGPRFLADQAVYGWATATGTVAMEQLSRLLRLVEAFGLGLLRRIAAGLGGRVWQLGRILPRIRWGS